MIRTIYRHASGSVIVDLPAEELLVAAQDRQGALWIDMISPTPDEVELVFRQAYNLHPLSIEDTINDVHTPKLDDYRSYLYMVYHVIGLGDERMDIHTRELDVFLGANFLITSHVEKMPVIGSLWNEEYHTDQGLSNGPVLLLYHLLDGQIDGFIPIIDRLEERLEDLGDLIFLQTNKISDDELLNDILTAKSSALRVRRVLRPQRDMVKRLATESFAVIPPEARIYFQDIHDHLSRLTDVAESVRDLASTTMETHLALVNNRMNEVMKVLTIISTIFIPLGFLAGVYGMNFSFMPELQSPMGYPLLWVFFLLIASTMIWFFRRRRWI
ncbi:MAG: magnesium/cobalt transporter CorA [Chloroflexota bacterium]